MEFLKKMLSDKKVAAALLATGAAIAAFIMSYFGVSAPAPEIVVPAGFLIGL